MMGGFQSNFMFVQNFIEEILRCCILFLFGVGLCGLVFVGTIAAQVKAPNPAEVAKTIKQKLASDSYVSVNYHVNGRKSPSSYDGPREGGQPDPKVTEKNLKAYLLKQSDLIHQNPRQAQLYDDRGVSYAALFEVAENVDERASYAEKALQDFAKAIDLDPTSWDPLVRRADLLKEIDFFAYFDVVVFDHVEAIRLINNFCSQNPKVCAKDSSDAKNYESKIRELRQAIARGYWNRARVLSGEPELLEEVRRLHKGYSDYSYWKDFDTALAYARAIEPAEVWTIITYLRDKGDAAYDLGKYTTALGAITEAKDYWTKKSTLYCEADPMSCDDGKARADDLFSNRLAKVYVKLKKWEMALVYVNRYLGNLNNTYCPEPFLTRAQIYRQLSKIDMALADEHTASNLASHQASCYGSAELWR